MFVVGDILELDLDNHLNKGFGDVEDELEFLAKFKLVPNTPYKLKRIVEEADDEDDLPPLIQLEGVNLSWASERFKLAAPLELENE